MNFWSTMENAPRDRILLLWAATDFGKNGEIRNWKVATGHWSESHKGWWWDGRAVGADENQPTHWMYVPEPPLTWVPLDRDGRAIMPGATVEYRGKRAEVLGIRNQFDGNHRVETRQYWGKPWRAKLVRVV